MPTLYNKSARIVANLLVGVALLLVLLNAAAQTSVMRTAPGNGEDRVKAAFLYKFISYVEWPVNAFPRQDAPYIIGVMDADDIANELTAMTSGRTINGRAIVVKRLQARDAVSLVHIVYIGAANRNSQAQILKQWQHVPALLVTDNEAGIPPSSMINLRVVDDRVRFEVALGPTENAGLKINSRLLSVAMSVAKGAPP